VAHPGRNGSLTGAFNLDKPELQSKYAQIPDDIDVLISHGPPYGYGDLVEGRTDHLGSTALFNTMRYAKWQLLACGHIHTGHGINDPTFNCPVVVNASLLDERYRRVYKLIVAETEDNQLLRATQR
jgi:Icc-related predicted phosphoesterase